ncbi:MAG TPA: N-acetylmuramic acid 6-phosphate etherase [Sporolactobacillaceae bacterium]|nr:N-acetylmuramic acid 6-phosphate etherase [Sporolactobacillaceae bacterium]
MGSHSLTTESINPNTIEIDNMSTLEMLSTINKEDQYVAQAIENVLPSIAEAVDAVYEGIKEGGRVFFVGAGTSGRLGVLEAAELPPTYGVNPDFFQALIAGGERAVFKSVESAEDNEEQGAIDLLNKKLSGKDIVIGIAASGKTPYVIGAIKYANQINAKTISIACNSNSAIGYLANIKIEVVPGPEVISGSTRMKAGTAQKLVLNMITTSAMIRLGKVYQNLMIDLNISNNKLRERAVKMLMMITEVDEETARQALEASNLSVKKAIVMLKKQVSVERASELLDQNEGYVRQAIHVTNESIEK